MKSLMRCALICAAFFVQAAAWAETPAFPDKVIRIVVPLGGGSGLDSSTRKFAQLLGEQAKQPVIVENKPGADAAIGIRDALSAPADGHTMISLTGGMLYMTPFLIKDVGYNPHDIEMVVGLGASDAVLLVNSGSKLKTLSDLIEETKRNGGNTFFGSYSQSFRGARVMLEKAARVKFVEVPYKGAGQMSTDLVGGAFSAAFMDLPSAAPLIKGGKVRALALASPSRNAVFPDIPTFAEAGYPGVNLIVWSGIGISRKTPKPIAERVRSMAAAAANSGEMAQFYKDRNSRALGMDTTQLSKFIDEETTLYKELLK